MDIASTFLSYLKKWPINTDNIDELLLGLYLVIVAFVFIGIYILIIVFGV